MDLTFEACDYLADLMARYARIEAHYRESRDKRDKALERALISVYVAILVYAAEVKESNAAKTLSTGTKSWAAVPDKRILTCTSPVQEKHHQLDRAAARRLEEGNRQRECQAGRVAKGG